MVQPWPYSEPSLPPQCFSVLSGLPSLGQDIPLLLSYKLPFCHPNIRTPAQGLKPRILPPRGCLKHLSAEADLLLPIPQRWHFLNVFLNKIWQLQFVQNNVSTEKMSYNRKHHWKSVLLIRGVLWTKLLALTSAAGTKKEDLALKIFLCEVKFALKVYFTGGKTCFREYDSQGRRMLLTFRTRRFFIVPDCATHRETLSVLTPASEWNKDAFRDAAQLATNSTLALSAWERRKGHPQ